MLTRILLTVLLLASLSCRNSKLPTGGGSERLYAHRWALVELDGRSVTSTGDVREAHLLFSLPNRLSGSTGCNRLTGTYELTGEDGIRFSPLGTTRMACPDAGAESRFVDALGRVSGYRVSDTELFLREGTRTVARLRATPVPQPR